MSGVTMTFMLKLKNNKGSNKNVLEMLLNYFISESFLKIADTIKIINILTY